VETPRQVAHPLRAHPDLMLVLVMAGCPLAMNIVQMWVQDTFLKHRSPDQDAYQRIPVY
jgi:hypothetical protein